MPTPFFEERIRACIKTLAAKSTIIAIFCGQTTFPLIDHYNTPDNSVYLEILFDLTPHIQEWI